MNKKEILENVYWSLYSENVSEWDALLAGDTETARRYNTSAAGQVKLAHHLLGARYYHKINDLYAKARTKAAANSAAKRQQKLGA